ncbi:MAG: cadherin-like beta sandwich domain-containing protein [Minisyncoccia bacterium]
MKYLLNKTSCLVVFLALGFLFPLAFVRAEAADVAPHNMTSNTLPVPYVASANCEYRATYTAWKAFDGVVSSDTGRWLCGIIPGWLKIDLGSGNRTIVNYYVVKGPDGGHLTYAPKSWTLDGSNDNSTWNTVDTVTNQKRWSAYESRTFTSDVATTAYRYYRLSISQSNNATYESITELYLYRQEPTTTTAYTLTGPVGGTNRIASRNFTITPNGVFTGTITPSDSGAGGTFTPDSLTWSASKASKTFTYTPASTAAKTISTTNDGGLTNPSSLTYYSTTPYTILPTDLWDNAYSTNETNYYLSSAMARLIVQTNAVGLKFTVWSTGVGISNPKVIVLVDGVPTVYTPVANGESVFYVDGLPAGTKTVQIISGLQDFLRRGTFLKTVEWFGPSTTITPPATTNRITFYGDSTTVGWSTTNPPTEAPASVVRAHFNQTRSTLLEAWGGRALYHDSTGTTVKQSLIDNLVLGNPSHIWLGIGVNDYKAGGDWSAEDFGTVYGDLLDRLHAALPNTKIIAQTPIPYTLESYVNDYGDSRSDYANQIMTLAASRSWVTGVDGTTVMASYSENGAHPNTAESAQWATTMEPYLELSTDATLSNLAISSGILTPTFDSETTSYTVNVANTVDSIIVTPTANDVSTIVTVNGTTTGSDSASDPISLDVGENAITIEATAQDGETVEDYTVTVTRLLACTL